MVAVPSRIWDLSNKWAHAEFGPRIVVAGSMPFFLYCAGEFCFNFAEILQV